MKKAINEKTGKIVIILGPTASGKSDIAIKLAKKFNGEIISADSRQVYCGMDIGTGKVPRDEKLGTKDGNLYLSEGVVHHLINVVSPKTEYNVSKFKKASEKIIVDILQRKKLPIICGGTGFWIKSIVDNVVFPEVKPDWELRKRFEKEDIKKLFSKLKKIDPERAAAIDPKNKVRLVRAIEICKMLGQVPKYETRYSSYDFLQIGIDIPKKKLHRNIERRLETRFQQGMVAEIKRLHAKNKISWQRLESFGLEYRWISLYLQKKINRHEMESALAQHIKDYAKRQMTWFKKDPRIKWLGNFSTIQKETQRFLANV